MKALIFDLDGTLIDSVYQHTLAWHKTLMRFGIHCAASTVHRRIGMSGRLLVRSIARELGRTITDADVDHLEKQHGTEFKTLADDVTPLPGARDLVAFLRESNLAHGIATSGKRSDIEESLTSLSLSSKAVVIDGDMVDEVKPEPDLFLLCQEKLEVERSQCLVIGDSVWDIYAARRSGILSVGLLSGGSGEQELYNAGAMRVYADARAMLDSIDELALR